MRRFPLVSVMVAVVATVLAVSLWTMQRAGHEALRELRESQAELAKATSAALRGYLESFDRDVRLLAELAQGTRRQPIDRPAQDRMILEAFQALATVVPPYRTIALFGPRRDPIVAVDPTEDRSQIAPALVEASAEVVKHGLQPGEAALRGPLRLGASRHFYLHGAPVGQDEAVVVTIDAAMMLEAVSRAPAGGYDLVVGDPSGAVWVGCQQRSRCLLLERDSAETAELMETIDASARGARLEAHRGLARLGLPRRVLVGVAPPVSSALGVWSVAVVGSPADLDLRQRACLWHLVLTSVGIAGAMLTVGLFMLRQHATAAALGARLQAAEELATLRERGDTILDNVPVGIMGITRDGRPAMANRFFQSRIASESDGTGTLAGWSSRLRSQLNGALAAGNAQVVTEIQAGTPQRPRDYHVRVVPLSHPTDDMEALAVVEDLSELHSLQRQLVRAEKLVTVGVLSAGIAHEVGTPLMVIRGRAEHMLESVPEGTFADGLRAIIAQIDRIASTIRQVLEFSRDQPIEVCPTDAAASIRDARALLDWRVAAKHINVVLSSGVSLPPLAAAPDQFEQVVLNLLMNACDASQEGGTIEVTLARDGVRRDHLRMEITDHGVGIAPENVNAVFDPYFTTKKRGEGTGLGLAMVSHIVRSHRGEISLKSVVNVGTTAAVVWPIAASGPASGADHA
jgi:signal transduction histidine kinase